MKSKKKFNWKKFLGFSTAILLTAGSLTGIGFGAYNIAKKTNISSDFREGRTFELQLRLFKNEENGSNPNNVEIDPNTKQPIPIYADRATVEENVKKSASYLTSLLEQKGLTNINVSYGFGYVNNGQQYDGKSVFENGREPVATLYAKFENSTSAFGLEDIDKVENQYINDKKVYTALSDSPLYELEAVKPSYNGVKNQNDVPAGKASETGRTGTLYVNDRKEPISNDVADTLSILNTDMLKDGNIGEFKLKSGKMSTADVGLTIDPKNPIGAKYFNSWAFGEDYAKNVEAKRLDDKDLHEQEAQDSLENSGEPQPAAREGADPSKPQEPTRDQKFVTTQTWIIWKNKPGLINYLNTLITLWYYNVYANNIQPLSESDGNNKEAILAKLFPTGDTQYPNGVDKDTRNNINKVINSLTDTEKSFIAWSASNNGGSLAGGPTSWRPQLINEDSLIPTIYNFYNSPTYSPVKPNNYNDFPNDYQYGVSEASKCGWWWLDSRCSDLNEFIGAYYGGTIDFRNFNTHFEDPNDPKEKQEGDTEDPIPDPYNVSSYKIDANDYNSTPKLLIEKWKNSIYKFPVIQTQSQQLINNWETTNKTRTAITNIYTNNKVDSNATCNKDEKITDALIREKWPNVESGSEKFTKCEYDFIKKQFAQAHFGPTSLYSEQYKSPATINKSIGGLNPLYVLLIIISIIVFLVGVFISWRYRIPGIFSFIISGIVFVCSMAIYNLYGFVFSFYSLLALAISTFISFITPSFLFKNIEKEISEGSTLSAAIIKSTKKYWKLSLDIHIMGILSSLAFLFFGKTGNVNFGSMLVISIFLSFILSGMIFFILLLYYVYVVRFEFTGWFISNKLYLKLRNTNFGTKKKIKFFNSVSFFNKWDYYVVGGLFLLGIVGVIVLGVHGPFFSIDFSSSNILIINNFNQFNITTNDVMNQLGISSINNYISDNQLVIYTINKVDLNSASNSLVELVLSKNSNNPEANQLANQIASNLLVTTLTSESALKIVTNAIACAGIAIGFCAIWALFSLNVISVIPLALNQVMTMILVIGLLTLCCIPVDINIVPVLVFVFMMNTVFSTAMLSSIKQSWDRKRSINKNDLALLFNNIISKTNLNYVYILGLILLFAILGLFSSVSLIFCFLVLIFSVIYMFFFNGKILITSLYGCVLLRNVFNKELKISRIHDRKVHEYDDVNEQRIVGINC